MSQTLHCCRQLRLLLTKDQNRYRWIRATKKTNPDFLNGVPELLILRVLDQRPMHGYDLVQTIRQSSGLRLDFGEGCVYPILDRLEKQRLLSSDGQAVGGRTRFVYRVTKQGLRRLAESHATWKDIVSAVNAVLQGGDHDVPALA
jgi:PadR family transcriptional regulator, regulatory protein PadR